MIALTKLNPNAELLPDRLNCVTNVRKRFRAVDVGFTLPKEVKVWPVHDENWLAHRLSLAAKSELNLAFAESRRFLFDFSSRGRHLRTEVLIAHGGCLNERLGSRECVARSLLRTRTFRQQLARYFYSDRNVLGEFAYEAHER